MSYTKFAVIILHLKYNYSGQDARTTRFSHTRIVKFSIATSYTKFTVIILHLK
jgi:hypothetical protein